MFMLLEKKEVLEILRCPKTGSRLHQLDDKLIAESDTQHIEYEIIGDCPIMIDFDKGVFKKDNFSSSASSLSSFIERNSYHGFLGALRNVVNPLQAASVENIKQFVDLLLSTQAHPQVLVVGGGIVGPTMDDFYNDPRISVVSFDVYSSPHVQFIADGHNIPLPDRTFDAVIVQAVLEHVLDPAKVVSEMYRVLKDNGIVYAETPFLQHVHEGAYDFTRYTESGHRYLFKNFELIKSGVIAGAGTQLLWSIDNFFRGLFRSKQLGKVIKLSFFWLQYFDKLIPDSYNVDAASSVFFMGRKVNSQISPKDILTHYKGAQF
jgi:SAM-dependent methyltransferase